MSSMIRIRTRVAFAWFTAKRIDTRESEDAKEPLTRIFREERVIQCSIYRKQRAYESNEVEGRPSYRPKARASQRELPSALAPPFLA